MSSLIFRAFPIFCFSFDTIPDEIKKKCEIKASTFSKQNLSTELKNSGVKPPKSFHQIYCDYCKSNILLNLTEKYKESLSEDQSPSNLIANWKILKVSNGVIDVVGCFLPEDKTHAAGPNAWRFIQRPTEHPSSAHSFTQSSIPSLKGQKQTKRLQSVLQNDLSPDLTINKVVVLEKSQTSSSTTKKTTLVGKYNKKMKFQHVGRTMPTKLSMSKSSKNSPDTLQKDFASQWSMSG